MTERSLLLLDDEENILRALKRALRRDGYRILTAESASGALELLDTQEIGVIITDQRMPEMSGTRFLRMVKERSPDTMRIVLTGYTELQSVTEAVNQGHIYKFLTKPWDDELLRSSLREAFEQYELRRENVRLTRELQEANHRLLNFNRELERRVKEKSRELLFQMRTLEISREILEQLPVAVMGIGDDGILAVTNGMLEQLLRRANHELIGNQMSSVLPEPLVEIWQRFREGNELEPQHVTLEIGEVLVHCRQLGQASLARGGVMVVSPDTQGQ